MKGFFEKRNRMRSANASQHEECQNHRRTATATVLAMHHNTAVLFQVRVHQASVIHQQFNVTPCLASVDKAIVGKGHGIVDGYCFRHVEQRDVVANEKSFNPLGCAQTQTIDTVNDATCEWIDDSEKFRVGFMNAVRSCSFVGHGSPAVWFKDLI